MKSAKRKPVHRQLPDLEISNLPNGPFDVDSPNLAKSPIYLYRAYWWEFFIPQARLDDFLKGQLRRDCVSHYTRAKSYAPGQQSKKDETVGEAPNAESSCPKMRASEAQRPKATYSVTFKCPHGPQDLRQECLLKQSQPTAEGTRVRATTTKWGCKAQFVMRHLEDAYTDKYGTKLCGIYYKIVDHGIHPDSTGSQPLSKDDLEWVAHRLRLKISADDIEAQNHERYISEFSKGKVFASKEEELAAFLASGPPRGFYITTKTVYNVKKTHIDIEWKLHPDAQLSVQHWFYRLCSK